jgi:ATP-binding cassette subfamily F protein uup
MALLTLQQACLAYGHVPLLDHCDFALEARERVGLIGRNGTGKSSLLRILAELERPDDGLLQRQTGLKTAYVAQEATLDANHTVFEAVAEGLADVRSLLEQYQHPQGNVDLDSLHNRIDALDGWTWEQRVSETLERLHLDANAEVESLSGGTAKRVALAQALVRQPDVLLLDEPTNHLDLEAIGWLEELLITFKGSVVVISHDRAFLDAVATRMVELDRGKLNSYPGNFSRYQVLKEEQLAQEAVVQAKADKLLAQEEVWIRKGVEARRTRAQARIERLKQLRTQRAARRDVVGKVRMEVDSGLSSGKLVAELTQVSKAFGEGSQRKEVVRQLTTTVLRGDKIGLIGPNGAGKTTLLKLILGELAPDEGTVRRGTQLQVAYFDQLREQLDLDATLEDFISPGSEWIEINGRRTHVKSYLGDFLFSPARAHSPVRSLSGGERNRLLLARLFARPANVLVLDEPTNDLDIETLELLEALLAEYQGTVFLVSHDRRFLDNVVTSTLVFEGNGLWREYEGGVLDWQTQAARARSFREQNAPSLPALKPATPTESQKSVAATANPAASPKRKLSYKEQRELEALPQHIEALEAEQKTIDEALADGTLYGTDPAKAAALATRHGEIEEALMEALERWDALSQLS